MKVSTRKIAPALILLVSSVLAYGLLIPWLGFYWDDWPMAWFAHTLGPLGFKQVLASDRPFLMGIYMLTTALLPPQPIYWQIFALISRWLCGVAVFWALSKLWPRFPRQMFWVSLLFTVFPGFKQQPISMIYGNGYILLTSFFISLGTMVIALQSGGRRKILFTVFTIGLQCFTIFSTEYYAGLELLRVLIIWYLRDLDLRQFKNWFLTMLKDYWPYALGLLAFFIWRVFIFKFPTYKPASLDDFSSSRFPEIIVFLNRVVQDIYLAAWKAWTEIFQFPDLTNIRGSSEFLYWGLVLILIPLGYLVLRWLSSVQQAPVNLTASTTKERRYWFIISAAAIVLGAIPFWATNLPIELIYPYDRFFLSLMFGSSLLLVYLIDTFIRGENSKMVLLAIIISFSVGLHFSNANSYRREWNVQNDFFWQLTWRVPAMQENTLLLAETFPLEYYSDNSLTAPLNWIYDTTNKHIPLKYMLFLSDIRLGGTLPDLAPNTPIYKDYRSTYYEGSTDDVVGFFYSTDACLHILDPQISPFDPYLPESVNKITQLSHPDRILRENTGAPLNMDTALFGKEPAHRWCYYYEKADLARQYQDWEAVIQYGQQAKDNDLKAKTASEYLPFMEAYAASGDWDTAMIYAQKAYRMDKTIEKRLCLELNRYQQAYASPNQEIPVLQQTKADIACR